MLHVDALLGQAVDCADYLGALALEHRSRDIVERLSCGDSETRSDSVCGDSVARDRDQLIEERQRVSHRTGGLSSNHRDSLVICRQALRAQDGRHALRDQAVRNEPEVVLLTT